MIDEVFSTMENASYEIFSLTWTDNEPRQGEYFSQKEETTRILDSLGPNSLCVEQVPILDALYRRFVNSGSIPDCNGPCMNKEMFCKYLGQIWGFLLAMDHWRERLGDFDVIIRSRWDRVLDPICINMVLGQEKGMWTGPEGFLYTMGVSIRHGQSHIGGDVIYGTARNWLNLIPSTEVATLRSMRAVKSWYLDAMDRDPFSLISMGDRWFTSHWLWTTILQGTDASIVALGSCNPILPIHLMVPADELTLEMVASEDNISKKLMMHTDAARDLPFMITGTQQKYFPLLSAWCNDNIGYRSKGWDSHVEDDGTVTWCFASYEDMKRFSGIRGFPSG